MKTRIKSRKNKSIKKPSNKPQIIDSLMPVPEHPTPVTVVFMTYEDENRIGIGHLQMEVEASKLPALRRGQAKPYMFQVALAALKDVEADDHDVRWAKIYEGVHEDLNNLQQAEPLFTAKVDEGFPQRHLSNANADIHIMRTSRLMAPAIYEELLR